MSVDEHALDGLIGPGARVAVADGCGAPRSLYPALCARARALGDLRLVLGWLPGTDERLDLTAFADVRTVLGGWGLRAGTDAGHVRPLSVRLSSTPALFAGPLRPDVLLVAAAPTDDGHTPSGLVLGSEVGWVRAVIESGVPLAVVVDERLPRAASGPPLPTGQVHVVGTVADGPVEVPGGDPTPEHREIGRHVAALVGSAGDAPRVQWAPGQLGLAVVRGILEAGVRVRADSGLLGDPVVDLDEAGLLVGDPVAAYLVGTERLYRWADERGRAGHPVVHRVEHTHDPARLAAPPALVSVNTAVEVDLDGQVNVEGTARAVVAGVGGHPDFATGASRSPAGRSVVAVASTHRGHPTLVERLSRPVTTTGYDVDVLVTEHGVADLRGLDRDERRTAVRRLWA